MDRLSFFYPFTPLGSILIVIALYLLKNALASRSPHEFLLSIAAFLILIVLAGVGRLQSRNFKSVQFEWDNSTTLYAQEYGIKHWLRTNSAQTLLFYRIHMRLSWRLYVGNSATLKSFREVATPGGVVPISLWFPACGPVDMISRLVVRDIFGLTRAQICSPAQKRDVVNPGHLVDIDVPQVRISTDNDTNQRARTSDQLQYFMRKYVPGDRMKDINWKVTGRIGELITRVSPQTEELLPLINISLRRTYLEDTDTIVSVSHLNFVKSWLLTFIKETKKQHPKLVFIVDTGGESHRLESTADIVLFAQHLAKLQLITKEVPSKTEMTADLYVFTTVFDANLSRFLEQCEAENISVFRSIPKTKENNGNRTEVFTMSMNQSIFPACIGGPWLLSFRRKPIAPKIVKGSKIRLWEDQPVKATYLCTSSF